MSARIDGGDKDGKTGAMISVLRAVLPEPPRDILVVGCGSGIEAGELARALGGNTVGIDIGDSFAFNHAAAAPARLLTMDARQLDFPDDSFDLIYSFHALEHIPNPERALREMARVLRPGKSYLIGTPNRSRMLGYLGSATSLKNKLRWNLYDLRMRLAGRWNNEAGAHAGFSEGELGRLCAQAFGAPPKAVSDEYYRTLYSGKGLAVEALIATGVKTFLYPCVYLSGSKNRSAPAEA